jgi:hypothetical protein
MSTLKNTVQYSIILYVWLRFFSAFVKFQKITNGNKFAADENVFDSQKEFSEKIKNLRKILKRENSDKFQHTLR